MKRRVTMALPGETEAGSAGKQPCRGIAWWAHRDDDHERGRRLPRSSQNHIGSVDPDALKIPARRAEYSLTESAPSPFQAEPAHGELLALTWDNLDWVGKSVTIARSLEQTAAGLRLKAPKNGKERRLSLPQTAMIALQFHRDQQAEHKRKFGEDYQDRGLVFAQLTDFLLSLREYAKEGNDPFPIAQQAQSRQNLQRQVAFYTSRLKAFTEDAVVRARVVTPTELPKAFSERVKDIADKHIVELTAQQAYESLSPRICDYLSDLRELVLKSSSLWSRGGHVSPTSLPAKYRRVG